MQKYNDKFKMDYPESISESILNFCKEINDEKPFFLKPSPYHWCLQNDCINNVYKYISMFGGKYIFGWAIWKNTFMIEAEFHCILVNKDGTYNDITPNSSEFILFLPDYKVNFKGQAIDNIRKPLVNNILVKKFIKKHEERFQLLQPYGKVTTLNKSKVIKIEKEISKLSQAIVNNSDLF